MTQHAGIHSLNHSHSTPHSEPLLRIDSQHLWSAFLKDVEKFSRLGRSLGLDLVAYTSKSQIRPAPISDELLGSISRALETYKQLLIEAIIDKQDPCDAGQLSWFAIKKLNLVPTMDFFGKIRRDDIVECYNQDQIQIFRSLRFFELVSYDLVSILTRPWHELYGRDEKIHERGIAEMADSLTDCHQTKAFKLEGHELWENLSEEKRVFWIKHRFRSPLFEKGKNLPVGIIMSSVAHQLR